MNHLITKMSVVVFMGWLGLLSVVSGNVTYDCVTQTPAGQLLGNAQLGSNPLLRLFVGNLKKNEMTYTPLKQFPVKISYTGGKVASFLLIAQAAPIINKTSGAIGTWSVSSGPAVTYLCSNPNDALIGAQLGLSGVIEALWTPPVELTVYVEFVITVVDVDGKFWTWNSALVQRAP